MKIKINGDWYEEFNDVAISTSLDSVATTFAFTGRYDLRNENHKELFKPLSFHNCDFYNDKDIKFITGQIVGYDFNSKASPDLVTLSGYSNGGVLEDCEIPFEAYPLESLGRSLKDITERLLKYFGIGLIIDASVARECNTVYQKSCGEPSGSVKDYLSKLTSQRNIVMSHDRHGNIIYYRPNTKAVSKNLYTVENTLKMSLSVQGQGLHSKITVLKQPSKGGSGASFSDSLINPLVTRYRPTVKVLTSGEDGETKHGVKSILAEELKAIKVNFEFDKWQPLYVGDIIEVLNPDIYINNKTRFMVDSTSISENQSGRSMTMTAVLPESFTGETPKNIFKF